MIYCIIRTPPKVALDRNGEVSLFERREGQLVYEGLTVGGMNLLAAAGIILAYTTMKSGTKSNTKLYVGDWAGCATVVPDVCTVVLRTESC